jgi:hypothetical protein
MRYALSVQLIVLRCRWCGCMCACRELVERYNALVAGAGVLSEDEFWAGVMAERARASAAATAAGGANAAAATAGGGGGAGGLTLPLPPGSVEQKKGLSNAMFQVPVSWVLLVIRRVEGEGCGPSAMVMMVMNCIRWCAD